MCTPAMTLGISQGCQYHSWLARAASCTTMIAVQLRLTPRTLTPVVQGRKHSPCIEVIHLLTLELFPSDCQIMLRLTLTLAQHCLAQCSSAAPAFLRWLGSHSSWCPLIRQALAVSHLNPPLHLWSPMEWCSPLEIRFLIKLHCLHYLITQL